jgi:hypothetical protein
MTDPSSLEPDTMRWTDDEHLPDDLRAALTGEGGMYQIVEEPVLGAPLPLAEPATACFARPKSRSFVWPRSVTKMLAGLMSRCTILRECAASRPSSTWMATSSASAGSMDLDSSCCFSVRPSSRSMTMKGWPSCSPISWMVQIFW